jgi:catechol 2,3-dioxygenase-like lactoylglutathione lyase family enzyme
MNDRIRRPASFAAGLLTALTTLAPAVAADKPVPVQSMHVRTMLITCRIDDTIRFWRDVLGQRIVSDSGVYEADLTPYFVDMPKKGRLRKVIFEGSGEYPAGNVYGSRIGFLGVVDTAAAPACAKATGGSARKLAPGNVVMPTRVANMKEILRRAKEFGLLDVAYGPHPSPSRLTTHTILYDPNGVGLELFELNVTPIPE